jgi:hypothetical protein
LVKPIVIILVTVLLPFIGLAQIKDKRYFDVGLFAGGAYYIGDINPNKHFKQTQLAGGALVRYNLNHRSALRLGFTMGNIEADDSQSSSGWQQQRNLAFRSPVQELALLFEFNFLDFMIGGDASNQFSPFVFFGLGGFHFNPKAELNNEEIRLQSLGTEGQELEGGASENKYKRIQPSIPIGIGAKFALGKLFCLGIEWGMRKTFTDYIDDVSTVYYNNFILAEERGENAALLADPSLNKITNTGKQRGDNTKKDWYSFIGITLTMKIEKKQTCANSLKLGGG